MVILIKLIQNLDVGSFFLSSSLVESGHVLPVQELSVVLIIVP